MSTIVGGDRILSGKEIFNVMDSTGLPLEVIVSKLRQRGMGFDVIEFIEVAISSGNFTYKKIADRLLACIKSDCRQGFIDELAQWKLRRDNV